MNELKNRILIIGHKGASAITPENTLKAFQKAIELEADYVEFDSHLTKDGEIVIIHDADTFNSTGVHSLIRNTNLEEIKKLDAGEGEQIPTLQELIAIAKGKIGLQLEIKSTGLLEKMIQILRKEDIIHNSIISSFRFDELLKLKEIEKKKKIGFLLPIELARSRSIKRKILRCAKEGFYAIHPHFNRVDKEIVEFAHTNGLKVNVWIVNDSNNMKNLILLGVDGIITDDISLAHKMINSLNYTKN
ncbi:MAG: glycerophosphodiester phosphodiesterase [Promethearchaeota archaeon]